MIYFEWDENKAERNFRVHHISFDEAAIVFEDPYRTTEEDLVVEGEQRWRTIGIVSGLIIVLVIHLEEDIGEDLFVRIISARRATPVERSDYDKNRTQKTG
jgi:uncharacterized protein